MDTYHNLKIKKKNKIRDSFLIFGSPAIEEAEIQEVADTLRSGWLSTGHKVGKFEELLRAYIGSKHALALNSCTAGLHLSLLVSGIMPGDEVITTPMTFAATANTIIHVGAKPVFVDIELPSMNINPDLIEEKITDKTKAIVPVHFAGRPCDMRKIMDIALRHNLIVIEDAAHALGAQYFGKKIGCLGNFTSFSFYVTKNIVTGEGGIVTTNDEELAEKIQIYSLHGMSKGAWKRYSDVGFKHYDIVFPGYKYNMMDIQAAIGIHQFPRIESYLKKREEIWKKYDESFKDLPVIRPAAAELNTRHARHLYTILLDIDKLKVKRDYFQQKLFEKNIGTGIHFISLHLHKFYREKFGYKKGDFPNAEYVSERTISLPLSAKLSQEDVDDVIEAVHEAIKIC